MPCAHALYIQACDMGGCDYVTWDSGDTALPTRLPVSYTVSSGIIDFANFANLVTYWTYTTPGENVPNQWWISDLDLKHPELIFTDVAGTYAHNTQETLHLVWSPDDLHVILDVRGEPVPGMIYHVLTKKREAWPWKCDRAAVSPHTGTLAMWCTPAAGEKRYAVIEWGGEIWYSDQPPGTGNLQLFDNRQPAWAWSVGGQQVAVLNPNGTFWQVLIADSKGFQRSLPFHSDEPYLIYPYQMAPISGSADGQRLLFQAHGSFEHPCPTQQCWVIADARSGQVIWDTVASRDEIRRLLAMNFAPFLRDFNTWYSDEATLSPDGQRVAFTLFNAIVNTTRVFVVDVGNHQAYYVDTGATAMRFCNR